MSKAKTLASIVADGGPLADGQITAADIGGLTLPTGGDIVGTTATQTLTNKTIDGASNTLSNVNLASQVTGTLPVANGGTGAASLTANNVLLGNGTSALQVVAPATAGNVLTSNGSTWTSAAPGASGGSATFTSSGSITAGQPVALNTNGTVSVVSGGADYVAQAQWTTSSNFYSTTILYHPPTGKFISFAVSSGLGYALQYSVGTYTAYSNISWTAHASVGNMPVNTNFYSNALSACMSKDNSYIILAFMDNANIHVLTLTVSGSTVTATGNFSTYAYYGTGNQPIRCGIAVDYCPKVDAYLLAAHAILIFGSTPHVIATVFTLSGSTPSNISTYLVAQSIGNFNGNATICPGTGRAVVFLAAASSAVATFTFRTSTNAPELSYNANPLNSSGMAYGSGPTGVVFDARNNTVYATNNGVIAAMSSGSMGFVVKDETGYNTQVGGINTGTAGILGVYNRYTGSSMLTACQSGSNFGFWYSSPSANSSTFGFRATSVYTPYLGDQSNQGATASGHPDGTMVTIATTNTYKPTAVIYTPPTSNYQRFVGIATSTVGSGESVTVTVAGGVNTNVSGLIPGSLYYVGQRGGLTNVNTGITAGIATSSTSLLLGNWS